MYKATYSDNIERTLIGCYQTLEEGAEACHTHVAQTPHEILCEEFCNQGGFDMAAAIRPWQIRLYAVDKVIK